MIMNIRMNGVKIFNGQFYNTAINLGLAYRINDRNILKLYSELFDGERHFSLIRPSETRTKYQDFNTRNLLEWESEFYGFTSWTRLAFLDENYKYFPSINSENFSFGEADTYIAKHELEYQVAQNFQLNSVLTNTYTNGKGSSLEENNRNIFSAAFLLKHWLDEKFSYEAGIRKEITDNYDSPVLFSVGGKYQFSNFYGLKFNASRNFRIPTYNDLYWTSSGNLDLNPEVSLQGELGNRFSWRDLELNFTAYYIDIDEMIRWLPGSDGTWRPSNVDEVHTYGVESVLNWKKQLWEFGTVNLTGTYAYTISENKQTHNQLTYVPYHKATAALAYSYRALELDYQFLFNGEVYTRSDNDSRYNLDSYMVSNLGASYGFGKNENYRLGARILNLFNEAYESIENRFMPGINFNIYLNLDF